MKIVNENNEAIYLVKGFNASGSVMDYLRKSNFYIDLWERLSTLVTTLTGDAITPFNTIGEMIAAIPDVVNYGEETAILCVYGSRTGYHILGWDYEDDMKLWNDILQTYFPNLHLEED